MWPPCLCYAIPKKYRIIVDFAYCLNESPVVPESVRARRAMKRNQSDDEALRFSRGQLHALQGRHASLPKQSSNAMAAVLSSPRGDGAFRLGLS